MCGIFGGTNLSNQTKDSIISLMHHRGPDGSGSYFDKNHQVFLAHTRLSIIDISANGSQPMTDITGNFVITFNGEIYNFKELKKELECIGYQFISDSDTEVVLYSFIEWQENSLNKLRGMFSFCIYSKESGEFFLARDRFGIKPLIYYYADNNFYFSSELRVFLENNSFRKKINMNAVHDFFLYGSVRQPNTIIENYYQLRPGHFITYKLGGELVIKKYYDLKENVLNNDTNYDKNTIVDKFISKFAEVSKYHLISDVEVSAFLSGGIDSSAVASMMQNISNKPIKTFNLLFDEFEKTANESHLASKTAEFLGTSHTNLVIDSDYVLECFDSFIEHIDQPSIDGINTFIISREVSKYTKVAISGLGGDEIFGGYTFYSNIVKYSQKKRFFIDSLLANINNIRPNRLTDHFAYKGMPAEASINNFRRIMDSNQVLRLKSNHSGTNYEATNNISTLKKISFFEIENYLLNTLLRDSDIASMANSLEIRPIFLDHELVEYVLSMPDVYKIENHVQKKILSESMNGKIPSEVLKAKKVGFEFPYIQWMNEKFNEKFKDLIADVNCRSFMTDIFNNNYLNNLSYRVSKRELISQDWSIFIFLNWYQKHASQIEF